MVHLPCVNRHDLTGTRVPRFLPRSVSELKLKVFNNLSLTNFDYLVTINELKIRQMLESEIGVTKNLKFPLSIPFGHCCTKLSIYENIPVFSKRDWGKVSRKNKNNV